MIVVIVMIIMVEGGIKGGIQIKLYLVDLGLKFIPNRTQNIGYN